MLYDLIDEQCANILGVAVEEYIEKIEKTTHKRATLIISALMSEDAEMHTKASRIFNLI